MGTYLTVNQEGMTLIKRLSIAILVLAFAALGLAACGDDSDSDTTAAETTPPATTTTTDQTSDESADKGTSETVKFEADPSGALKYTQDKITAKAGEAEIDFDNPSSVPHDVVIEDSNGNEVAKTEVITDDSESTTADLKAGTYTYYCSVPGHRQAGMEGTLTVK